MDFTLSVNITVSRVRHELKSDVTLLQSKVTLLIGLYKKGVFPIEVGLHKTVTDVKLLHLEKA